MITKRAIEKEILKTQEEIIETNRKIKENLEKLRKLYKPICITRV